MTDDYFSHSANQGRSRKEVAHDVVDFEPVAIPGTIEVYEHTEGTGEFRRLFAELQGRRV